MEKNINEDYKKYYNLKELIGEGSFGKVFKIENKNNKELKAIKIFNLNDIKEKIKEKYFTNEITDEINNEFKKYINMFI